MEFHNGTGGQVEETEPPRADLDGNKLNCWVKTKSQQLMPWAYLATPGADVPDGDVGADANQQAVTFAPALPWKMKIPRSMVAVVLMVLLCRNIFLTLPGGSVRMLAPA